MNPFMRSSDALDPLRETEGDWLPKVIWLLVLAGIAFIAYQLQKPAVFRYATREAALARGLDFNTMPTFVPPSATELVFASRSTRREHQMWFVYSLPAADLRRFMATGVPLSIITARSTIQEPPSALTEWPVGLKPRGTNGTSDLAAFAFHGTFFCAAIDTLARKVYAWQC